MVPSDLELHLAAAVGLGSLDDRFRSSRCCAHTRPSRRHRPRTDRRPSGSTTSTWSHERTLIRGRFRGSGTGRILRDLRGRNLLASFLACDCVRSRASPGGSRNAPSLPRRRSAARQSEAAAVMSISLAFVMDLMIPSTRRPLRPRRSRPAHRVPIPAFKAPRNVASTRRVPSRTGIGAGSASLDDTRSVEGSVRRRDAPPG